MRRFEGTERGKRRFHEIEVEGRHIILTSGLLDGTGRPKTTKEEWANAADAKAQAERFVARKVKAGFEEQKGAPKRNKAPEPAKLDDGAFAKAILADRDDAAAWLVYADALQAAGDPRGELIVVQEARVRTPKDRSLARAEDAILDRHYKRLVGAVVDHQEDKGLDLTWKNGFFDAAWVRESGYMYGRAEPGEVLRALFASPSARFLDALTIESSMPRELGQLVTQIAGASDRPPLRALSMARKRGASSEELDANRLLTAFPALRALTLEGRIEALGDARLRLEVLALEDPSAAVIASLTSKPWPSLRRLSIGCGGASASDLEPIVTAKAFPNLVHLGLRHVRPTDEIAALIAESPLFQRLQTLDLGRGHLTAQGARAVVSAKRRKKLDVLDVSRNRLDPRAIKALSAVAEKVLAAAQRRA